MVLILAVLLAAVVLIVVAPLRGARDATVERDERAALTAAKEAKYREIRDAELDYRTGKLSERDYRALDRQLRSEAVAILDEIDRLN